MFVSGFLILFGIILGWFPCEGQIISPPDGKSYVTFNGATKNITWSFYGDPSKVISRAWFFTSSNGVFRDHELGTIIKNGTPNKSTSLFDVEIKKPGTLLLKNVNETYDGTYRFDLSGADGAESRSVVIFIATKPTVILNCPSPVMLNEGDNFTCLCKGEGGSPPAKVAWFNDGVNVSLVGTRNQTLKLLNVSKEDNGTYTCNATSYPHENYTDEKSIVVIVYIKPHVTTDCDSSMAVNEGVDVTCYCECKDGNPPANCTWFKNGILTGKIGRKENTLNRLNIKRTDGGNYTCVGKSHSSAIAKKLTTITVYYVEVNFYSPNNDSVTITCTSSGPRLQDYTIYHNGTEVARNMSYTISTVNGTHPGLYNCNATNGLLGELSTVKFLDANMGKPTPSIASSTTTRTVPSSSTTSTGGGTPGSVSDNKTSHLWIVGVVFGVLAFFVIVGFLVRCYCKRKSEGRENTRGNADVNPNGSKVMTNDYELEEDHGEDAGAYDTVKQSDDGEGSQDKKKPAGDSLPPVYASVNKDNRQGNTLYASLDSEALRKPGSKKKQPETKYAPTEYASIDFMQTEKTPNADNA